MTKKKMIAIKHVELEPDPHSGNKVILKEEADSSRYFVMLVGDAEFAILAKEKGMIISPRPLTHDLYLSVIDKLDVQFERVEVIEMRNETFYARVVFRADGTEYEVDSRPSDAVALALNREIPILVKADLFHRELTAKEVEEYKGLIKSVKF